MGKLERAILELSDSQRPRVSIGLDARALVLVTLMYLLAVLSVPLSQPERIVWMAAYPIIMAGATGLGYEGVLWRSLMVLPVVVLIGIFNPLLEREVAFTALGVKVSRGWVSFFSIVLRGVLSAQALLILVMGVGFDRVCRCLSRLGTPDALSAQLMMVWRYMGVLLEEALSMKRARQARGYGRRSFPVRMWGAMIGQLFLRTLERSRRIHRCMMARGFSGKIRMESLSRWDWGDTVFVAVCGGVFAVLRFVDISEILFG